MKPMEDAYAVIRTRVLLSVQRALLGEVFPSLRGVSVGLDERSIRLVCYVDGPVSPMDLDRLSGVEAEVIADFSENTEVRLEVIRCDVPAEMRSLTVWAYRRREN